MLLSWKTFFLVFALLAALPAPRMACGQETTPPPPSPPPPVLAGCEPDSPPCCVADPDGQASGSSVDLLRAALPPTGESRHIQTKWLSPDAPPGSPLRKTARIALWAIFPLLALLLLSLLWTRSLHRLVARRTRELSFNLALLNARSDASLDGILVVDDHNHILSRNPRFDEMWNLPPGAPRPASARALLRAIARQTADPRAFLERVKHLHDHQQEISREEIPLKDGRIFERYSAPISGAEGRFDGRVWYFRDLSDRKRAEEARELLQSQLIQAQKMESMGRLAGGVAHDFNNMLGVIIGHTELALDRTAPEQPLHANLQEIQTAARRSSDLTRQLLAFARKQDVAPRVLDLNATVEGMLKMLRRLIGEDINLAWRPGHALWPVLIDPSQIDQILANLCVNARDAIHGVGRITIETETVSLDEPYCASHPGTAPGDYVRLAVSDTGCGMPPETLAKIFEPFFTTKRPGEGTGLGLATVYGIVQQNNGCIHVYSEPGHGSVFHVYLPRHQASSAPSAPGEDDPLPRGSETILLVEDEPAILKTTRALLEKLGYRVLPAATPGEAIRLAKSHPGGEIQLLMTDVIMPGMNGRDLTKVLVFLCPGLHHLFMSGYTADVIAHHGVLDEGMHFLQKPFTLRKLAAAVRNALDS